MTNLVYFYARVSSKEQNFARQLTEAKRFKKVDRVFCDKQSGKNFTRTAYQEMKSVAAKGDEVIVMSLDRLGRNKEATKEEIKWFRDNGVILRILDLPTSLCEWQGQEWVAEMVNNILIEVLASYAEVELHRIRERQAQGIAAKRASGNWADYGRPRCETPDFEKFLQKQKSGQISVDAACQQLGISRSTWYDRARAYSARPA